MLVHAYVNANVAHITGLLCYVFVKIPILDIYTKQLLKYVFLIFLYIVPGASHCRLQWSIF